MGFRTVSLPDNEYAALQELAQKIIAASQKTPEPRNKLTMPELVTILRIFYEQGRKFEVEP